MSLFYKKHFIGFDTLSALIGSSVLVYLSIKYHLLCAPTDDLVGVLIQALTGLLGFIIAVSAILFALDDGKKLQHFKASSQYGKVMQIYVNSIKWIGMSTLALVLVQTIAMQFSEDYEVGIFVFIITLTTVKVWRCVWITDKLFKLSVHG